MNLVTPNFYCWEVITKLKTKFSAKLKKLSSAETELPLQLENFKVALNFNNFSEDFTSLGNHFPATKLGSHPVCF